MNSCESEKKRIEGIRGETREDLKIEEALTSFSKPKIRKMKEEKLTEEKNSTGNTKGKKEKEWKCPNCKISKEESIGLDTLVYAYPGSTMPQFYCRECGFVNPPADWIRQQRSHEFLFVKEKLKEKTPKQLYKQFSKFFY